MSDKQIQEFSIQFNNIVRKLIRKIADVNVGDANLDRLKKRTNLLIRATPLVLLEKGSPYIWDYREEIDKIYDDVNDKFNWDVISSVDLHKHVNESEEGEHIGEMINAIVNIFNNAEESEKEDVYNDTVDAIELTAKYRTYCKKNNIELVEI